MFGNSSVQLSIVVPVQPKPLLRPAGYIYPSSPPVEEGQLVTESLFQKHASTCRVETLPSGIDVPLGFHAFRPRWLLTSQIRDPFGVSIISFNIYSFPLNVRHAKQSVHRESDLQIQWGQGHLACGLGLHCRVFATTESDKVKKRSEATASCFVFAQPAGFLLHWLVLRSLEKWILVSTTLLFLFPYF